MTAAPQIDSNTLSITTVIRDIKSLQIAKGVATYAILGKKTDGSNVSWSGTSRDNALIQLNKFLGRMA